GTLAGLAGRAIAPTDPGLVVRSLSRERLELVRSSSGEPTRLLGDVAVDSAAAVSLRSEEHTSELQSRFDLVCRLLLEKKKPGSALSPSIPKHAGGYAAAKRQQPSRHPSGPPADWHPHRPVAPRTPSAPCPACPHRASH